MDTKLTLKLNQLVIEKAKAYAKSEKTSVSSLIENYLLRLTETKDAKTEITPLVKSLSGILDLSPEEDLKQGYVDYLSNKYK